MCRQTYQIHTPRKKGPGNIHTRGPMVHENTKILTFVFQRERFRGQIWRVSFFKFRVFSAFFGSFEGVADVANVYLVSICIFHVYLVVREIRFERACAKNSIRSYSIQKPVGGVKRKHDR